MKIKNWRHEHEKTFVLMVGLTIMLNLVACSGQVGNSEYFGFSKEDFTVEEEADTHGGFYGDGSYYLILDCSESKEKALENLGSVIKELRWGDMT